MRFLRLAICLSSVQAFGLVCAREVLAVYYDAAKLQDTNRLIERGRFNIASLEGRGIFTTDSAPVHPLRDGVPDPIQTTGFRRVWVPRAHTGFLIPEDVSLSDPRSIAGYDGYSIVMPGIGTDRSNAMSLITIGQELKSGKQLKSSASGRKLKLLPVLVDATLSGMGDDAPLFFGEPHFVVDVIKHVHLVMKTAFPQAACVVMGRSQGGLYAMEYAQRVGGVAGVIAMSPSPTRADLLEASLRMENLATLMDTPLALNRSDLSYRAHTTSFRSFGTHTRLQRLERWFFRERERAIPLLILLGAKDDGYPAEYFDFVKEFVAEQPHRELEIFEEGGHDLWTRRNRSLLRAVMERQATFLERVLQNP